MKLSNRLFGAAAAALLVVACGSSDSGSEQPPAAQPGTVNKPVAKQAASQTINAATQVQSNNDGVQAASNLQGAAAQAQGIIQPSYGGAPSALLGETIGQIGQMLGTADGCSCDEASKTCTYTNCTPNGSDNLTINGSLSWGGGKVVAKGLSYDIANTGALSSLKLTLDCDLTVGATQIDGSMHTSGSTAGTAGTGAAGGAPGGTSFSYEWDTTIKFNAVTYSGGQPTGGSIDVSGSYAIKLGAGGVGDQTYAGSANVTFP
jgi:hypothetical protein